MYSEIVSYKLEKNPIHEESHKWEPLRFTISLNLWPTSKREASLSTYLYYFMC